ncbi:MAG: DoxX family protein [Bacteroidales bacterium]|nr:DoxX family protein [Bacteroidales bacterium]
MRILRLVCRIITGLVFIFSGTVKAIDPLGSTYKFQDYFQAFNLDFLKCLSLPLAIFLSTTEFIAGFSVLTGIRQKTGIRVIMILMIILTPLTLVLAITNPVSDCGCFGDAIHLTNWQTFGKNVILLIPVLLLFLSPDFPPESGKGNKDLAVLALLTFLFLTFNFYNLRFLPVIDFLPYKTGANIADKMAIPANAPVDEYITTFIYEKDGIKKEFTIENYPAGDTAWKFAEQKSVLVKKGFVPPIHDFSIASMNNEDLTSEILNNQGYTLLMISRRLKEAKTDRLSRGFELGYYCLANNIGFYILTASSIDEIRHFDNMLPFCHTDETTLKTIIRSNPGYVLLKDGTIAGKWSWANLPAKEMLISINP